MEQASRSFMTGIRAFSASSASHYLFFVTLYCSSVLRLLSGEYRCLVLKPDVYLPQPLGALYLNKNLLLFMRYIIITFLAF